MIKDYKIALKKATDLTNPKVKTTASGIRNDFSRGEFPLYFHSYNPGNSFIAVPPEWLKELADKAGDTKFVKELGQKIEETKSVKETIIKKLRKNYQLRVSKKK